MSAMWIRVGCSAALAVAGVSRVLPAQQLSLADALGRAEQGAYANRIAAAQTRAEAARLAGTLRGILPSVRLEGGYVRTSEPLSAFGTLLRQRAVTPAAFEPSSLNYPAAINNVNSALVIEQPIFNPDALLGRRAAARGSAAARASEEWTRSGTQLAVVRAYFGAVLATEQVRTLLDAARAAAAHAGVAQSMHRNGLVTRSDALLASVRAGEVELQLVGARQAAELAHARLAVLLGMPPNSAFMLPAHLPDTATIARLAYSADSAPGVPERADIRAANLRVAAATADEQRATALFLPRVNSFGRLDWNAAGSPFGGSDSWTAGIMLSWPLISGGAVLAERQGANARRTAAAAEADALVAQQALERQEATNALVMARARMTISGRAVGQSAEAHRIVARRYEGGLASVVELFDAAAEETAVRLGFAEARYQAIVAMAEGRRAAGLGIEILTRLESTEP